ncbi:MAG: RNA polymerase sigma factor, partial [Bacteroidales bacterium]|nr:RNA polymerase sigma factor [Bacteroidales bacterium]
MKLKLPNIKHTTSEEAEILSQIRNAKTREQGYARLIEMYSRKIYWQIRRMVYDHEDSDDLTQEVFIKIFENIETFNSSSKLSTWIFRITYNHTLNFLKYKNKRMKEGGCDFESMVLANLPSDPLFDGNQVELMLQKAILSLPPKQRAVFQMRYYDDLSFAQISQITKTSEGALKASYHFAVEKI